MSPEEVSERFIEAAELEKRLPKAGTTPRGDGAGYILPWVHSETDIRGRGKTPGDQLTPGDDPLRQWRDEFWAGNAPLSSAEMGRWEEAMDWVRLRLDDPKERRALWHWAIAKAGGKPFTQWCRREGIAVETGRRRKNRAILRIAARDDGRAVQPNGRPVSAMLLENGEITYFPDTIAAEAGAAQSPKRYTWRNDESLKPLLEHGSRSSRRRIVGFR